LVAPSSDASPPSAGSAVSSSAPVALTAKGFPVASYVRGAEIAAGTVFEARMDMIDVASAALPIVLRRVHVATPQRLDDLRRFASVSGWDRSSIVLVPLLLAPMSGGLRPTRLSTWRADRRHVMRADHG
jgi:hypothetical protein